MSEASKVNCDEHGREALKRLAAARDAALAQSNRFLLLGLGASLFYAVKLAGLRIDLVVLDTKIFDAPYGLFIFGVIGAASFILAQLRYLDGEALDLQLKRVSPDKGPEEFRHGAFPSKHHWLSAAQSEFGSEKEPLLIKFAFGCLGIVVFSLYISPLFAAAHFLVMWPRFAGETYTDLQWWLVFVMLLGSILVYCISQWLHFRGGGRI